MNFITIFLQRFSVVGLSLQLPLIYLYLFYKWLSGKVYIKTSVTLTYTLFIMVGIASYLLNVQYASIKSMVLLISVYSVFLFHFESVPDASARYKSFSNIMFFTSIVSLIFFALQPIIGNPFNILDKVIPETLLTAGYNTTYETGYNTGIFKNNGLVFLEPSFFSQFIAISIMIETIYFKNNVRLATLFAALFTTFSGTGMLMIIIFYFLYFFKLNLKQKIYLFVFGLAVFLILIAFLPNLIMRVFEANSEYSSSFIRFVSPFLYLNDFFSNAGALNMLIGFGSGSADETYIYSNLSFNVNFFTVAKLIIEYGLIGLVFFSLYIFVIFKGKFNLITIPILFKFAFFSGALLEVPTIALLFLFYSANRDIE